MKYSHGENANAAAKRERDAIRPEEINKIIRQTRVGDKIRCRTHKADGLEDGGERYGHTRTATIIAKYPHFYEVEYANGIREAFKYSDLVPRKKKRGKRKMIGWTCKYHIFDDESKDFVCNNEESEGYGEYTMYNDSCECYEEAEKKWQ